MIDQHASLSEKFLKKGVWLYLFSFIIAPMGYIIKIIISSELTVSEVGILYGIISLISIIYAYNDLGMTQSINHFIPKFVTEKRYDKVKTILIYAILVQYITGISIALFFYFGADIISNNYFKTDKASDILRIFSIYFVGINIFQIISTFFISIQNTFLNKAVDFCRFFFVLMSIIIIYFLDLGNLITFSYAWLIGLYLGIIISTYLFYKKYYKNYLTNEKIIWDKKLFLEIFKYSLTIFIGAQAGTLLSQIDMQMVTYILGTTQAGYYTNYLSIITIPFMIIGPIFILLFPIFSEMHAKGETEKIRLVKKVFQKNFLAIGTAFIILFFIFSEIIAYIFFGEKFIKSGTILQYSILFLAFNFLLQINFNILSGMGKAKERSVIVLIAVMFNIITNLLFINLIGVYGAALATGIGWVLIYVLSEYVLGKKYRIKYDYKYLIKNLFFMGLLGFFIYYYVVPLFEGYSRLTSLIYLSVLGVIWFSLFILLNWGDFKIFVSEIKKIRKGE